MLPIVELILGVIIDSHLTFTHHDQIVARAFTRCSTTVLCYVTQSLNSCLYSVLQISTRVRVRRESRRLAHPTFAIDYEYRRLSLYIQ